MGDHNWYVCLKCEELRNLTEDEGSKWLLEHWGHMVLETYYNDEGVLEVDVHQGEAEG